ncbi:hypothetical protein HMPREF9429_01765 [Megasphaera micronuciformis F0359]|uniref:Uncharacterized protein n=1 Tax=Megasphaera micronuciformis F0359 TaxID=706434 RepID=E2ZE63_9FIRM|nr:hypothetical protein HMPREF9429_01765 [Megasphaera micronuciformis F0359]
MLTFKKVSYNKNGIISCLLKVFIPVVIIKPFLTDFGGVIE